MGLISNYFLRLRLKERLNYYKSKQRDLKVISSLLVVCTDKEMVNEDLFIEFAQFLKLKPSQIILVVLSDKEIKMENKTKIERYLISKQSIGFFGKPPAIFSSLIKKSIGLQLNFFNEQSAFHDFMAASFDSNFRIGFSKSNEQINDLILAINPSDHSLFLKESKKYLNALLK